MRMNISNIDSTFKELSKQINEQSKTVLEKESKVVLTQLVLETPVDTGRAQAGWELNVNNDKSVSIVNDVPYIEALNNGHSQQAPAHFVENIALQHGRPKGSIITVK